jgi:hypothetical protein
MAAKTHRSGGERRPAPANPAGAHSAAGPGRELLVAYSTNVHPGEDLDQVYRSLRQYTLPVRDRVFGKRSQAGLELRLGIGAARELLDPGARERFGRFLEEGGLRLFSINAYPLLDFHQKRVKESVFRPPWTDPRRALWTRAISCILADLLPAGVTGSVSTLGGSYRAWGHGVRVWDRIARGYLEVVETLAALEEGTGKRIVLAVEPEPDTTFECSDDLVSFFEDHLLPQARARWKRRWSGAWVESLLRRHFTVNLDTCHLSVVFRKPHLEMERLARAGIAIGKVHVTSALAVARPRSAGRAYQELRALREPRYLHQVRGADSAGEPVFAAPDLGELPPRLEGRRPGKAGSRREAGDLGRLEELRAHFHVPIHAARWRGLATTQSETREAVVAAVQSRRCRQLVIETYTWPLLAREEALVAGIAREFRWLLKVIEEAEGK